LEVRQKANGEAMSFVSNVGGLGPINSLNVFPIKRIRVKQDIYVKRFGGHWVCESAIKISQFTIFKE